MKKIAVLITAAALSAGCASTAGPFVTNLSSDGNGNIEVERCMLRYDRMIAVVDNQDCQTRTVRFTQQAEK